MLTTNALTLCLDLAQISVGSNFIMTAIPLLGGRTNGQVSKVDNTVHRSVSENSSFVHELLKLLEEKNYQYSPRFISIDTQGREVLTFIEGEILHEPFQMTINQLSKIAHMLRDFHDSTSGSILAGARETVCHNDIAPWNTIWHLGNPVAFIDFDEAAPGKRIDDVAYFLWTFLELGSDKVVKFQASRISTLCNFYGNIDLGNIVDAILNQQNKILIKRELLALNAVTPEEKAFSAQKALDIKNEIHWMLEKKDELETYF